MRQTHKQRLAHRKEELQRILEPICANARVAEMRRFTQHGDTSTFAHCYRVAWYTYRFCSRFGLKADEAARGAMLHDLFLYDWHKMQMRGLDHATQHPAIALRHASAEFPLTEREKDIIRNHMWPMTPQLPRSAEGKVVSTMDKVAAVAEVCDFAVRRVKDARYRHWNLLRQCFSLRRWEPWMA
jgi:uncharacterized protein